MGDRGDKRLIDHWPLLAGALGVAITYGALQEQVSNLRADVTDIQAVKPDVLKEQISSAKQTDAQFRNDVTASLKDIKDNLDRIDRTVANIAGKLGISEDAR